MRKPVASLGRVLALVGLLLMNGCASWQKCENETIPKWAQPTTAPRVAPATGDGMSWINLPDPCDFDPCDYHANHHCRACAASITDADYLDAGLFMSLCPACLAATQQTLDIACASLPDGDDA